MKANEERENCGVFRVKDTHTMYTYIFHLRKRYASLLCDYLCGENAHRNDRGSALP
jgi:hypothetical protein